MKRCTHHGDEGTYIVRCACGNVWKYGHYIGRVAPVQGMAAMLVQIMDSRPEDILRDAEAEYRQRGGKVMA